ncbi:MAG: ParB/RepB/Spo0J family partition protein [Canidatus Methanoxibalbensis ujae]|nr:ParB/RepB/Spo0J family partition protein [Candidatus Methanoxibalbensis ujae]
MSEFREIEISKIIPPEAPARLSPESTDIESLAESIKSVGLINPITVRKKNEKYEVVAGHRRFLACQKIGMEKIPCIVTDDDEKSVAEKMLAENLARHDMTPLEEACFFKDCIEQLGHTPKSLGEVIGKSREYVIRRLRILDFPTDLQKALHEKSISLAVAEELARVDDPETRARYLMSAIESQSSAKVVKSWVDMWEEARRSGLQTEELDYGILTPVKKDPIRITCQICGRMHPPQSVVSVIMCRECIAAINAILRELEKKDGRDIGDVNGGGSGGNV